MTLAFADKCIPEWLSISCSLQDWDLVYWEAACLVWSPESCVTAARCSCARMVHWKVKVTSSVTDVWQQLFEQQDITVIVLCTIHFHPWLHENHTSAPAPGDTDWNQNAGTCLLESSEVCSWAEMADLIEIWSAELQWSIDRSVTIFFIACLKAKIKHFEHLLWCVSLWYVTVMTFKAYTTAVMNKLTYVSLQKVEWKHCQEWWSILLQFCCKFTKLSVCQKLWKYEVWQSYCKNNKGAIFFASQCSFQQKTYCEHAEFGTSLVLAWLLVYQPNCSVVTCCVVS